MANTEVGSAYLSIYSKVDKGFTSAIDSAVSGAVKGVKAAGVAMGAALTGTATAIGAVAMKSFEAYSSFEQLEGGAKLAFGDAYDYIEQRSKEAFSNVQMSQNDYLEQVNGLAVGLREALGGDNQAAAELADKVVTAEADIVAAMGITDEAAQNAFNGIMKGNYTMLDNLQLGITPTKAGMQEVIDKVNEWRVAQGETGDLVIDNLADCQAAVVDYVEMMGYAGYASNEGMSTIQGSISATSAAWENWIAELGKSDGDMETATANLTGAFKSMGENAATEIGIIATNVAEQLPAIISTICEQIPVVAEPILRAAVDSLGSALTTMLGGLGIQLPEGTLSFDSLTGVMDTVSDAIGTFVDFVRQEWSDFTSAIDTEQAKGALETLGGVVESVWGFVESNVSPLLPMLGDVLGVVANVLIDVASAIADLLSGLGPLVPMIAGAVAAFVGFNAIAGVIGTVVGALSTLGTIVGTVTTIIGTFGGIIPTIAALLGGIPVLIAVVVGAFVALIATNEDVRAAIVKAWEAIKATVAKIASGLAQAITGTWSAIKSGASSAWNGIKTTVTGAVTAITSGVTSRFNALKSTVAGIFNNIKTAITRPIGEARQAVSGAIEAIKHIINGAHLELPRFKLPHFRINGGKLPWGIGGKGTAPSINVDWYAQGGAIEPNNPRLIGVGDSNEREWIEPESKLKGVIADAVRSGGGAGITIHLNYTAGDDATTMARDLARQVRQLRATGAI